MGSRVLFLVPLHMTWCNISCLCEEKNLITYSQDRYKRGLNSVKNYISVNAHRVSSQTANSNQLQRRLGPVVACFQLTRQARDAVRNSSTQFNTY